jgi:hypothetical protein
MTSIRKVTLGTVVVVAILGQLAAGFFYSLASAAWRTVQTGMTRKQVVDALGRPDFDTYELKGQDMWWRRAIVNERRLIVRYGQTERVERVSEIFHWRGVMIHSFATTPSGKGWLLFGLWKELEFDLARR